MLECREEAPLSHYYLLQSVLLKWRIDISRAQPGLSHASVCAMMEWRAERNSEHYTNPALSFSHEAAACRMSSTTVKIVAANSQRATCVHPNRECSTLRDRRNDWCLCGCMSVCVCRGVQVCACWDYWKVVDMLYASGHVKWHSVCHTAKWEWLTFILARECLVLNISAEELF